jgi:hypothetical protein
MLSKILSPRYLYILHSPYVTGNLISCNRERHDRPVIVSRKVFYSIWKKAVDQFSIAEQFLRHSLKEMACSFTVTNIMKVHIFYCSRVWGGCRTFNRKCFHAVSVEAKYMKFPLLMYTMRKGFFNIDNVAKTSDGKFFNC